MLTIVAAVYKSEVKSEVNYFYQKNIIVTSTLVIMKNMCTFV